jgi:hypothetical protein
MAPPCRPSSLNLTRLTERLRWRPSCFDDPARYAAGVVPSIWPRSRISIGTPQFGAGHEMLYRQPPPCRCRSSPRRYASATSAAAIRRAPSHAGAQPSLRCRQPSSSRRRSLRRRSATAISTETINMTQRWESAQARQDQLDAAWDALGLRGASPVLGHSGRQMLAMSISGSDPKATSDASA